MRKAMAFVTIDGRDNSLLGVAFRAYSGKVFVNHSFDTENHYLDMQDLHRQIVKCAKQNGFIIPVLEEGCGHQILDVTIYNLEDLFNFHRYYVSGF